MDRSARTRLVIAALVLGALGTATALAAARGATVDKTGWWNRANTTTESPTGPVTVPPPPGVPDGDLVVGATNGEPSAVTAIGIQPDEGPGATVIEFTLTITEDPDARGNRGTGDAAIVACPITDFWAGGTNGTWDTRPDADCEAAAVEGTRDDDGTWTFDLAPIGALWFDEFGTMRPDGVLLTEAVDPPTSFQAVFLPDDAIEVVLEAEPAPEGDDPFDTPSFEDPPSDPGRDSGPGGDGDSIINPPVVTSPPTTFAAPEPPPSDPADDDDVAAPPVVEPGPQERAVSSRSGDLVGNLPPITFVAVPLFLALLAVMSYWLGPAGQPVTTVRQRGVSRALEARARAEKGL